MTTAVVTAASGQIGSAVAHRLLAEKIVTRVIGVDVVIPPATTVGIEYRQCDLRDPQALAELARALPEQIFVLVNVLGGERHPAVAEVADVGWPPPEVWDDIIDLNLGTAYRLTRLLAGRITPGGAICNVSSIAATMPWVVSPAYGAAKAALEHWSGSLAVQMADQAVRVNMVRPGFVWSRQWQAVDRAEFERVAGDRVPLRSATEPGTAGREQLPADIAASVSFLCSPAALHVTGQAINVDGGAALVRAAR